MKPSLFLYFSLAVCCFPTFAQAESPADMISSYRIQHGDGRVVMDSTLTRIAHEQAGAVAAKDKLDHDVLGGFTSRVHSAGAGRVATKPTRRTRKKPVRRHRIRAQKMAVRCNSQL